MFTPFKIAFDTLEGYDGGVLRKKTHLFNMQHLTGNNSYTNHSAVFVESARVWQAERAQLP